MLNFLAYMRHLEDFRAWFCFLFSCIYREIFRLINCSWFGWLDDFGDILFTIEWNIYRMISLLLHQIGNILDNISFIETGLILPQINLLSQQFGLILKYLYLWIDINLCICILFWFNFQIQILFLMSMIFVQSPKNNLP